MKIFNLFILYIYFFNLINNVLSQSQCSYTNSLIGQTYDLAPIALAGGFHREVKFNSLDGPYKVLFNFCNRLVNACLSNNPSSTACQLLDGSTESSNVLALQGQYTKTDSAYGMNLSYKTPSSQCPGGAQREFVQYLKCNLNVEYNVTKAEEIVKCKHEVYIDTKYVCPTIECPNSCSPPHGVCQKFSGTCDCSSQTKGLGCEQSRLSISSVYASNVNGGQVIINGYFGTTSSLLTVLIGAEKCTDIIATSSQIVCTAPQGYGEQSVTVIDRDLYTVEPSIYKYKFLKCPPCSGTCNGLTGVCE